MTKNSSGGFAGLNPLIRKGIRERLRLKQLIAWGLLTLILTSFTYLTAYLEGSDGQWIYDEESENWEISALKSSCCFSCQKRPRRLCSPRQ